MHISIANSNNSVWHLEKLLLNETYMYKTIFPIDFSGKTEIRKIECRGLIKELIESYNQETLISIL